MTSTKRFALFAAGLAGAALTIAAAALPAAAQGYPTKPITMVVPFAAGGPTDVAARLIADHMSRTLGQQVVIENVAGAGGTVGTERVAKAQPDGYTVLFHHQGITTAPALYSNLRFDTKSLTPLGKVNTGPMIVAGKNALEAKTAGELFDWMKKNADKITLAHAGVGSNSHVCSLIIQSALGAKFTAVAYRGTGPAMNDLVSGQIDVMCDNAGTVVPQVTGGTIRAYMIADDRRIAQLKDVPHAVEAGFPAMQMSFWHGVYGPPALPADIVAKINDAIAKAIADPAVAGKFEAAGTRPFDQAERTADAHKKRFLSGIENGGKMLADAGIKAQEAK